MKVTDYQRNIIKELITEKKETVIAQNLNVSVSKLEKDIKTLKELFKCQTLHGLIFRYYYFDKRKKLF